MRVALARAILQHDVVDGHHLRRPRSRCRDDTQLDGDLRAKLTKALEEFKGVFKA